MRALHDFKPKNIYFSEKIITFSKKQGVVFLFTFFSPATVMLVAVYNESSDSYQTYVERTNTFYWKFIYLFQHNQIYSIQKSNQVNQQRSTTELELHAKMS